MGRRVTEHGLAADTAGLINLLIRRGTAGRNHAVVNYKIIIPKDERPGRTPGRSDLLPDTTGMKPEEGQLPCGLIVRGKQGLPR